MQTINEIKRKLKQRKALQALTERGEGPVMRFSEIHQFEGQVQALEQVLEENETSDE